MKRILFLFCLFFLIYNIFGSELIINYYRYDKDYKDWNVWIWPDGKSGSSVLFNDITDYGVKAVVSFKENEKRAGFIIRKGEWEEKDVDFDRYIDLNENVKEIWLLSGDSKIYKREDLVDKSDKIISAFAEKSDLIKVILTRKINLDKINNKDIMVISDSRNIDVKEIFGSDERDNSYFSIDNNNLTFTFDPEENSFNYTKDMEVYISSSFNNWKKDDNDNKMVYDKNKNIFVLQKQIGVKKNQVPLRSEFKFYVKTKKEQQWVPDNNVLIDDFNYETDLFYIKTISQLPLNENSKISIEKFGDKNIILKDILEDYSTESWLGYKYSHNRTEFRLWSPISEKVLLLLFDKSGKYTEKEMINKDNYFELIINEDLDGYFYQYKLVQNSKEIITSDPWAVSCGVNGEKSAIIDLEKTDPENFENSNLPKIDYLDSVIYESHIRDFTVSEDSGIKQKGTFAGYAERNTYYSENLNIKTGIEHLKELGITHVHLLPVMDFASVDENKGGYNWGYDPYNYFCLEGSYSTEPQNPYSRIKEFKELVKSLHDAGIRVVLDVVYNHTYSAIESPLGKTVPYYFYRITENGKFGNGSGCGNETASERKMFKKHMIDSMLYFADEFNVDGFRFDLMALHDKSNFKDIIKKVKNKFPHLLIYGEPWNGGPSVLSEEDKFYKGSQKNTEIAVFNDNLRNAVKGDPDGSVQGFATGDIHKKDEVIQGLLGAINEFAENPDEVVNYVTCHDNLTLTDKIKKVIPNIETNELIKRNALANSIIMFSQGIPFLHSGVEILRDKNGNHNSYNAGDHVNKIIWKNKEEYFKLFKYYQKIIKLRKEMSCFKYDDKEQVLKNVQILNTPEGVIGIYYKDLKTYIYYNANKTGISLRNDGKYKVLLNGVFGRTGDTIEDYITLDSLSTVILQKIEE